MPLAPPKRPFAPWISALAFTFSLGCDAATGKPSSAPDDPEVLEDASTRDASAQDASEADADAPDEPTDGQKFRRAELKAVKSEPSPPSSAPECDAFSSVSGRLDLPSSIHLFTGGIEWILDAYLVTAVGPGPIFITSSVSPDGGAQPFGYGYPLSQQDVEVVAGLPALTVESLNTSNTIDNALDDGRATMQMRFEPGRQYVVIFKSLVGIHPDWRPEWSWNYDLTFCASQLKVEGKLWVSQDSKDLVRIETVTGLITTDNAPVGAISKIASELDTPSL